MVSYAVQLIELSPGECQKFWEGSDLQACAEIDFYHHFLRLTTVSP